MLYLPVYSLVTLSILYIPYYMKQHKVKRKYKKREKLTYLLSPPKFETNIIGKKIVMEEVA